VLALLVPLLLARVAQQEAPVTPAPSVARVEAEQVATRSTEGGGFARPHEARWASGRRCLVGFNQHGERATWQLEVPRAGEQVLWLRYAARTAQSVPFGLGHPEDPRPDVLEPVPFPATGAYEGKHAWGWVALFRGRLEPGPLRITLGGAALRPDALLLLPAGIEPPSTEPPPVPERDPEQLASIRAALLARVPTGEARLEAAAPGWYEAVRVSVHTRLSPRWRERPIFEQAEERLAALGVRELVRHVRTGAEGAWWPSAVGASEPWAEEDPVAGMVARAHEQGLRLVGYYRHMEDAARAEQQPDWLCREGRGGPPTGRRGPRLCLNAPYGDELLVRLGELVARGVDGIYFDEDHLPEGGCCCPSCRALWAGWTGGAPFPESGDPEDPLQRLGGLFANVSVERFFARARAALCRGEHPPVLLISSHQAPDLFSRHLDSRLGLWTDGLKTEYGTADSAASRAFLEHEPEAWLPARGPRLALGWALSRDAAGGRPPHVWVNGLEDATTARAATGAVIAWGGVANLDVKEERLPDAEVLGPAIELGNALGAELVGTRPVRWAALHWAEAARDACADERAAWRGGVAATLGAWEELLAARAPAGLVTDGELARGVPLDVRVLVLPTPAALDAEQRAAVRSFQERGGAVLSLQPARWADATGRTAAGADLRRALTPLLAELPVRVEGGDGGLQVVLHRERTSGRERLALSADPGWVWTGLRTLRGGGAVQLPQGVDRPSPPLGDELRVRWRDGHEARVVLAAERVRLIE